jgi:seryl-tRNA synthetase
MSEATEEPKAVAAGPETKAQLVQFIKSWIETDNEMHKLQKDMKTLRDNKKTLTDALVNVMKSNEIDVFDINDGKLVYAKTKVKAPINKTTLFSALMQHYNDEDAAKKLSEFIMDSRQDTIKESIRRKIQKK